MKPDGMLVEPAHIISARQDVANQGNPGALHQFGKTEPALGSFILEALAGVAGKLSLSGAPTELVQGCHEEILAVVLTCVQALRRGHYALWKDTAVGTRLEQLDETLRAPRRRRPKKGKGTEASEGTADKP
jgi:hypothetical protein